MGERAKAAFKEILSSDDFAIISLKHFQLFGIANPGQDIQRPTNIPENSNKKDFILLKVIKSIIKEKGD